MMEDLNDKGFRICTPMPGDWRSVGLLWFGSSRDARRRAAYWLGARRPEQHCRDSRRPTWVAASPSKRHRPLFRLTRDEAAASVTACDGDHAVDPTARQRVNSRESLHVSVEVRRASPAIGRAKLRPLNRFALSSCFAADGFQRNVD